MPPDFVERAFNQLVTPVPSTPGVNASVPIPAATHDDPTRAPGHWLDNMVTGRADMMTTLMHPEVVRDRMRAEEELAGRFQIVDGKTKGPRLPNQVTMAEFHKLANTYSDIRLGRGDLSIDPSKSKNPDQFKADMMDDIADVLQTKSGRALIEGLNDSTNIDENGDLVHRKTTLMPYNKGPKDNTPDYENSDEIGDNREGFGVRSPDGTPGVGSNAKVRVNPNHDVIETEQDANGTSVEAGRIRSDVVLFHELAHAYSDTRGITDGGFVQRNDGREKKKGSKQDPNVVLDADSGIRTAEHQAAGLGKYKGQLITENSYRRERNELGKAHRGMAGDLLMPQRTGYSTHNNYFALGGL